MSYLDFCFLTPQSCRDEKQKNEDLAKLPSVNSATITQLVNHGISSLEEHFSQSQQILSNLEAWEIAYFGTILVLETNNIPPTYHYSIAYTLTPEYAKALEEPKEFSLPSINPIIPAEFTYHDFCFLTTEGCTAIEQQQDSDKLYTITVRTAAQYINGNTKNLAEHLNHAQDISFNLGAWKTATYGAKLARQQYNIEEKYEDTVTALLLPRYSDLLSKVEINSKMANYNTADIPSYREFCFLTATCKNDEEKQLHLNNLKNLHIDKSSNVKLIHSNINTVQEHNTIDNFYQVMDGIDIYTAAIFGARLVMEKENIGNEYKEAIAHILFPQYLPSFAEHLAEFWTSFEKSASDYHQEL